MRQSNYIFTYDATGNLLATYKSTVDNNVSNGGNYVARFSLEEQQLYGSSRLGIKKINEELFSEEFTGTLGADIWDYTGTSTGQNNVQQPGDRGKQIRGDVRYELTDHLGNVRSVITDRKLPTQNGGGVDFAPDVVSAQDYYPFGMLMPGRQYANASFTNNDYRFGFQGQEGDDEIVGKGNSYGAMYWQYDSRLGRRWNIDPVKKHHESPYAAFSNNPIWFVDPLGNDTLKFNGNNGNSVLFIHPSIPKSSVELDYEVSESKVFDYTDNILPDALGYNVEMSVQGSAGSPGVSGTLRGGISYVVYTKGEYAFQPFKYAYGGGTGGVNAIAGEANLSVGVSFFAANFDGANKDVTPDTWTKGFVQSSWSISAYAEFGGSVGVTGFQSLPANEGNTWTGVSIDLSVGAGGGFALSHEVGPTYYVNTEIHVTKTADLYSSNLGVTRLALKFIDMRTSGVIGGVQLSDALQSQAMIIEGNTDELIDAVKEWWDGIW